MSLQDRLGSDRPVTLLACFLGADEPKAPPPLTPLAVTQVKDVADDALPFVYTQWKHFTVEDGLPNDHIFAVKADGPKVWIGTEDGLACCDKRTGKIRSWKEKDGLPFQAVTAIDVDKKTGRRLAGPLRRRPGPVQRRPVRPLPPAQQRAGQRRRLRRGDRGTTTSGRPPRPDAAGTTP